MTKDFISRRRFIAGTASLSGLALAGCASGGIDGVTVGGQQSIIVQPNNYAAMYGPLPNERFPIPAVNLAQVPEQFYRRQVDYPTPERVGTVVVDTSAFYLYHVQEGGRAMRYGVGLGRQGFSWSGRARIAWKRPWPTWTPPDEMIAREPDLAKYSADNGGMEPGLDNPLGARALYIFEGDQDTLYRLHGTAIERSIGRAVSSGCVRLLNQDVIDLYQRVQSGSEIVVT